MTGEKKRKGGSGRRCKEQAKKPKPEPVSQIEDEEVDKKPQVEVLIRRPLTTVRLPVRTIDPDTRLINLNVNNLQDGVKTPVKIKRCTPLKTLMTTFYDNKNMEYGSLKFLLDGRRVRPHQTPQELEMEDGDEIDAASEQWGGSINLA